VRAGSVVGLWCWVFLLNLEFLLAGDTVAIVVVVLGHSLDKGGRKAGVLAFFCKDVVKLAHDWIVLHVEELEG
jgi:hypothetical protein